MTEARPGAADPHRGMKIGKYEVITLLSVGGMAELFLAFTAGAGGFKKYVVIKRVLPDLRSDDQFRKMLLDEGRITAALSHQNIAQTYDLGDGPDGLYLAMEFVSGQNLNQVVNACAKYKKPIPIGFSAMVGKDLSLALHSAHSLKDESGESYGLIHRDVAHKNVMVTFEGMVKLLDFGIAKAKGKLEQTRTGMVKGTTGYMSPEQVMGQPLDGRSDLFSVGVMLHELLTGRRLFSGKTELEEMKLILEAPIPKPHTLVPEVPKELSEVVMKALARERTERFQTGREMAKAIERAAGEFLFDEEATAAFMAELFEDKVKATRALLESAGRADKVPELRTALNTINEMPVVAIDPAPPRASGPSPRGSGKKLSSAGSEDLARESTALRPSRKSAEVTGPPPAKPGRVSGSRVQTEPLIEEALPKSPVPRRSADRLKTETISAAPPKRSPALVGLWVLCFVLFVGSLAFAAHRYVKSLERDTPEVPVGGPPPPEPVVLPSKTQEDPANPGVDPQVPAGTSPQATTDAGVAAVEERKPDPPKRIPKGSITLVTNPDADVYLGRSKLGRTPMFSTPIPIGTHLLKLRGKDGVTRVLSVPVKEGQQVSFRLKLNELPKE